jgi:signal transduction histidine kinase
MSARICLTHLTADRNMNTKYVVVIAAMAVMLVAATALATDSAFADKNRKHDGKKGGYEKNQAISQVNDCGNGNENEHQDLIETEIEHLMCSARI